MNNLSRLLTCFCALFLFAACGDLAEEPKNETQNNKPTNNTTCPDGPTCKKEEIKPTAPCPVKDTQWIARPMTQDANSKSFAYVFHYKKPATADQPTIIYLPGGPGQTGIETEAENVYPDDYGVINTDPRGIGCNGVEVDDPTKFFTTEQTAQDIVEVIKHLKLDNYIIHGVSYGTFLASVVAHKLETQEVTPPRALILEGTLGRAFKTYEETISGYTEVWEVLQIFLEPQVLEYLKEPDALGVTSLQWASIMASLLTQGGLPGEDHPLVSSLNELTIEDPMAHAEFLKEFYYAEQDFSGVTKTLYQHIACREITDKAAVTTFKNNQFEQTGDGICDALTLQSAYDIKNYPFTTPTYYFQGEFDPNTPMWQADYHFANTKSSNKTKVIVPNAGHNPLSLTMAGQSCLPSIFGAISQANDLDDALMSCDFELTVETN